MNIKAHTSIIGETGYNNHSRNFFTAINKFHTVKIRNFTVGKSWKGNNKTPHEGEKYLSKEHKEMLYEQILWVKDGGRGNFPIYSFDERFVPDINITLEPINHYLFYDDHKGYNVGYNVWETTEYPQSFFNLIHKYDQFWVPTKWQKDNLVKQGYPQDKVKIVPEGIDPEVFKPAVKKPADKFRFILFGKWEYRKSTQEILSCFLEVFKHSDDVELIASIDNDYKVEMGQTIKKKLKDLGLENDKIKLLHFPPASEYIDHLQQGDVFISCARSEGWNLPLIEAMACGIPSIYSNWGAQLEFAEGRGVPVKIKGEVLAINDDGSILIGNYCEPDWEDFKRVLSHSYFNHKALKEKALKDSEEIRKIFTWENAAKIASQHLTKAHFLKKDIPVWFGYSNFYDEISKDFHDGYKVVEVGAWLGRSTAYLANKVKHSKKKVDFHTIDTWKGSLNESDNQSFVKDHGGSIFEVFLNNLQSQNLLKYVTPMQDSSQNAAKNFSNNSLDAIMINAGHSYDAVRNDILYWYSKIKPGGLISGDNYGGEGVSRAVKQFFHNVSIDQHTWKYRKPRIQAVHLRTRINDSREVFSKISLEQLKNYGIDYTEHVNQIYTKSPPKDFCRRPADIESKTGIFEKGLGPMKGAHYGCYLAHRQAIESIDENYDYTLIFEADAILAVGYEDFFWKLNKCIQRLEMDDVYFIGLANNSGYAQCDIKIDNEFHEKWHQDLAHAYLIPNKRKTWYLERIKDSEWDSADLWFNHIFCHHREKRYTYREELFKQASGLSIIDEIVKW